MLTKFAFDVVVFFCVISCIPGLIRTLFAGMRRVMVWINKSMVDSMNSGFNLDPEKKDDENKT